MPSSFANTSALSTYVTVAAASLAATTSNDTSTIITNLGAIADLASLLNAASTSVTGNASTSAPSALADASARLSLLQTVAVAATNVASAAATGAVAVTLTAEAVSSVISSVAALTNVSTAGAGVIGANSVSLALSTLNVAVAINASALSSNSVTSLASATASLVATASGNLSQSDSLGALSLFSTVASSTQVSVSSASTVTAGLASVLTSSSGNASNVRTQGMTVVSSRAAQLNSGALASAAGGTSAASDAVRASLLSLVAATAVSSSAAPAAAGTAVNPAPPPSSIVVDSVVSAVTALMNTSGTAIVTGADTVRVGQGVVENILTSVSGLVSGATASNLTAGSVANLAALTATSVATSSSISNAGANAAVLLCMTVAASPASTVGVASNVVFSISGLSSANVSTSTRNGTAAAANASMPFVTTLAPVLNAVSSSLLRLLTSGSTNSSSIRISSPNMNITVAAVPVNATNGTALAVGNAVVPAAALASVPTTDDVHSVHYSISFDPHSGLANTSGVTRLEFYDANGTLHFGNLSSLITFELPGVVLAGGMVAQAQFWDESTSPPQYSSYGCVTMPNPSPPGVNISWDPAFNASLFDDLRFAWVLSGPATSGCRELIQNCSDPGDRSQLVSLDPDNNIGRDTVGCGANASGAMRVLYGANCSLWHVDAAGCYWNATYQRFMGAGCVTANITRLATRHLTDYMAAPSSIAVASPAQLSLSPSDLRRLRLLVIVVCVIFGIMHVGAFILSFRDARELRLWQQRLLSPKLGHRVLSGAPVWRLRQEPLQQEHGRVCGSAVEVAEAVGIPFVRLACAIPEAWLGVVSLSEAVGRTTGLSPSALRERATRRAAQGDGGQGGPASQTQEVDELTTVSVTDVVSSPTGLAPFVSQANDQPDTLAHATMPSRRASLATQLLTCGSSSRFAALSSQHAAPPPHISESNGDDAADDEDTLPDMHEVAGTALMQALLAAYCFGSAEDAAAQHCAYMLRLSAAGMQPTEYLRLHAIFKEMLTSGGLRSASHWWPSARLWRCVLTAQADGYWEPHGGIATALLASTAMAPRPKLHGVQLVVSFVQSVATLAAQLLLPGGSSGTTASAEAVLEGRRTTPLMEVHHLSPEEEPEGKPGAASAPPDCPLAFSGDAIIATMPAELLKAKLTRDAAARVWTTLLVATLLPQLPMSWRVGPHGTNNATLADRAQLWLEAQLADWPPELRASLRRAAAQQLTIWAVVHDRQLTTARFAHIQTAEHGSMLVQRSLVSILYAALTQHATISIFTAEALVGARRWCAPRPAASQCCLRATRC